MFLVIIYDEKMSNFGEEYFLIVEIFGIWKFRIFIEYLLEVCWVLSIYFFLNSCIVRFGLIEWVTYLVLVEVLVFNYYFWSIWDNGSLLEVICLYIKIWVKLIDFISRGVGRKILGNVNFSRRFFLWIYVLCYFWSFCF